MRPFLASLFLQQHFEGGSSAEPLLSQLEDAPESRAGKLVPKPYSAVPALTISTLDGDVTLVPSHSSAPAPLPAAVDPALAPALCAPLPRAQRRGAPLTRRWWPVRAQTPGPETSVLFATYSPEDDIAALWSKASLAQLFAALPENAHVVFAAADMAEARDAVAALRARARAAKGFGAVPARRHFQATPVPLDPARARNALEAAAMRWGAEQPSVTLHGAGGADGAYHASGATDWAPLAPAPGAPQRLEVVLWGGDGCGDAPPPPAAATGRAVLVERGPCAFIQKARRAAAAGAAAVLVANSPGETGTAPMSCALPDDCTPLDIPVAMVSAPFAAALSSAAGAGAGDAPAVSFSTRRAPRALVGADLSGRLREAGRLPTGEQAHAAWRFAVLEARYWAYEARLAARRADAKALEVPLWADADGAVLAGGAGLEAAGAMPPLAEMRVQRPPPLSY